MHRPRHGSPLKTYRLPTVRSLIVGGVVGRVHPRSVAESTISHDATPSVTHSGDPSESGQIQNPIPPSGATDTTAVPDPSTVDPSGIENVAVIEIDSPNSIPSGRVPPPITVLSETM